MIAIKSVAGNTLVHNRSSGVIDGSIDLTSGAGTGTVQNDTGGTINSGAVLAAASVHNGGTLDIGGKSGAGAVTQIRGDLVQDAGGRIVIDSDQVAGRNDRLTVTGNAALGGRIELRPTSLTRDTLRVVDVQGGLDASQLQANKPMLFNYALSAAASTSAAGGAQQSIYVTPHANFVAAAAGLGAGAQSVASHLQSNFDAGAGGLAPAFAQMANGIQDPRTYRSALNSLGNESQQAVGTARLAASHAFVERMNSCPTFDAAAGTMLHERECVWGRAIDNRTDAGGAERVGYTADTQSMQFGGQRRIADGWYLGGSAAYDTTSFQGAEGTGNVNGHGATVGAVLKRELGAWTFSGAADLGQGTYDTSRNITFPGFAALASGEFRAQQAGLHSRIAYMIPQDAWYLKPYLDLHAVHIHTSSYTESGAGALGLSVSGASDTMLSASPMLEAGGRWDLDGGMALRPYMALGAVVHNKNAWGASSQLIGSAPGAESFTAVSTAPTRLGKVSLGADLSMSQRMQLRVEYGGQFGKDYHAHEGVLRLNYLF